MIVGVFQVSEIALPLAGDAVRMPMNDMGSTVEQPFCTKFAPVHVKNPLSFCRGTGLNT